MRRVISSKAAALATLGLAAGVISGGEQRSAAALSAVACCQGPVEPPVSEDPAGEAEQDPPRPADKPGGVSVRGTVAIGGAWGLQKPDLTRVVIYLASEATLDATTPAANHETVAQQDKKFIPNFLVVARGTTVEFPNWDDFDHNVFSRSKAAPAFDLDRYPKGFSKSRVFDKTGVVQVFCNIHPKMRAIIFVTPNPYFARADADGKFELKVVPPGRHEVVVWQERCGEQRRAIEVGESAPDDLSITLEESRAAIMENNPKRDAGYGVERGLGVKRERLDLPVEKESHPAPDPPPK